MTNYMNVSVKYFHENFINEMKPILEPFGFEFNKASESFLKSFDQGRQYFNIRKMSRGIEVELNVIIVNSIVREIIQNVINVKDKPHDLTLWWQAKKYNYDKARFFITTEEEIEIGRKNTVEIFNNFALPLFEKYSTIEGIDSLVNTDSEYPLLGNKSHDTNAMRIIYTGLITAKLLNRPDFEKIRERNLSNLDRLYIDKKDACMARFNAVDFDKYRKQWNLG